MDGMIEKLEHELKEKCCSCPNLEDCCAEIKHETFEHWFKGENKHTAWLLSIGGKCNVRLKDNELILTTK